MKSFDQQVADWARTKPEKEEYSYTSPCGCAIAQFLVATGMASNPAVGSEDWYEFRDPSVIHPISEALGKALCSRPHTFGALADRLSERGV